MTNKTKKKSINKKSAKMKKYNNKGGVIGLLYNAPTITKRSTIKKLVPYSKELVPSSKVLTPSPLRKVAKTFAKSRIAKTLKKKFLMSKQAKILAEHPDCVICLEKIDQNDEPLTLTPCYHVFHSTCLKNWLSRPGRNTCPICRTILTKPSSTSASGLTLLQIEQLRREMQNINPEMQNELITNLCNLKKLHWILKEKINWVKTHYPILYASFYPSDAVMQEMTEGIDRLETLIKNIIAIYSDVFPEFKHLFQTIYNSRSPPYSMTLEYIVSELESIVDQVKDIYEDSEDLVSHLTLWRDTVMELFDDIYYDTLLEPVITIANTMVDNNN